MGLAEELDVQSNGPHEEVDIAQSLTGHVSRQCLTLGYCLHDSVPACRLECLHRQKNENFGSEG